MKDRNILYRFSLIAGAALVISFAASCSARLLEEPDASTASGLTPVTIACTPERAILSSFEASVAAYRLTIS
ncbi:MAG TPA: hypothetical protein PK969_11890, partial [Treponemataceae bacterium]|nr:hypothetical protein [Treponemataceae bacterium]